MHKFTSGVLFAASGELALVAAPAFAQDQVPGSPYVERDFPLNVYFEERGPSGMHERLPATKLTLKFDDSPATTDPTETLNF